ncbi:hypothetical protein GCM10028799_18680 [Kribbella italica]
MNVRPVIRPASESRNGIEAIHEDCGTTDVTNAEAATTQLPTTPRTKGEGTRMAGP